jgi:hypothetical protein
MKRETILIQLRISNVRLEQISVKIEIDLKKVDFA